jgi:hypothetical protein
MNYDRQVTGGRREARGSRLLAVCDDIRARNPLPKYWPGWHPRAIRFGILTGTYILRYGHHLMGVVTEERENTAERFQ